MHLTKDPDDIKRETERGEKTFWDYSFQDLALYDFPATIKYVAENSGFNKITLVGHSQGSTATLTGMTLAPEIYKKHLNLFVGVAPASRLKGTESELIKFFADNTAIISILFDMLGMRELFGTNWLNTASAQLLCSYTNVFCGLSNSLLTNADPELDDPEGSKMFFKSFPSGTSSRSLLHFGQVYLSGELCEF